MAVFVGGVGGSLVDDLGRAVGERTVDEVGVAGHPADVGATPEDIAAFFVVEDVVERVADLGEVTAGGVDDALGLTGGARGVEQEEWVFGVEGLGVVGVRLFVDGVFPPHVAAFDPVQVGVVVGTTHDEDLLDGFRGVVAGAERLVDLGLQRRRLATAVLSVGGDDELGLGVVDAGAQRSGGEAGEDHGVGEAEAGAGEHRDQGLGDHRHVDGDAIAGDQPDGREVVGGLADLGEQLAVGEVAGVAGFTDPVDGDAVALACGDVPIHAVDRDVELASDEPLGERGVGPVEGGGELGGPVQPPGLLGPELEAVGIGMVIHLGGAVGLGGELVGGRKCLDGGGHR